MIDLFFGFRKTTVTKRKYERTTRLTNVKDRKLYGEEIRSLLMRWVFMCPF